MWMISELHNALVLKSAADEFAVWLRDDGRRPFPGLRRLRVASSARSSLAQFFFQPHLQKALIRNIPFVCRNFEPFKHRDR
jgi:hypothetical protein